MIRNPKLLRSLEASLARNEPADFVRNQRIFSALYQEACSIGVLPMENPMDGIENDIRLARILNVRKPA
jgi:hypothetical protein